MMQLSTSSATKLDFKEVSELLISLLVISFAFSNAIGSLNLFPVITLIVALTFIPHELAHRFMANRYCFYARYELDMFGLVLAILSSFLGFVFAAPGAVRIYPVSTKFAFEVVPLTRDVYGKIAIAGPVTNIVIGLASYSYFLLSNNVLFLYLSSLSLWIALFNSIPFHPLDGEKVLLWNKWIWLIFFTATLSLFIILRGFAVMFG